MDHLFERGTMALKNLKGKCLFIFLDFDGTLAPIAQTPAAAMIPARTRQALKELSECPGYKVAVISGRAIEDIKSKVGIKNIIYSGNHGLELEGPKIKFRSPVAAGYKTALKRIKQELEEKLSGIKGVLLEDKGVSFSLHYRSDAPKDIPMIKSIFHETAITYLVGNKVRAGEGKMVFELRPPVEWDKGKIIMWLLARQRFSLSRGDVFPVFIGDDTTDEDAFRAIGNKGLTVFVGKPGKSSAQYYLRGVEEVFDFLKMILEN